MQLQSLNFLHCKECTCIFSNSNRPLILRCGHTFCEKCLKNNFFKNDTKIICFLDNQITEIDNFSELQTNYSIMEALENYKGYKNSLCQIHNSEFLRFFCRTHNMDLCQNCLINHLGNGHDVISKEEVISIEPLKQKANLIQNQIDQIKEKINISLKDNNEEHNRVKMDIVKMKQNLEKIIDENYNNYIQKIETNYNNDNLLLLKEKERYQDILLKCQEISNYITFNISSDNSFLTISNPNISILKQYEEYLDIQSQNLSDQFFKKSPFKLDPIILSKEDIKKIMELQIPYYDPKLKKLLLSLKNDGIIKSDLVLSTMSIINRRDFLSEENRPRAYQDSPLPIGWNTTISAPHMHALTLESLKNNLKKAKKALDIGCGSGYISACMAEIMGKNTETIAIDHIEDIINFSINNVKKKNGYLLEDNRLRFIKADGRKGFKDFGPYDVIHVGGALSVIPKELEEQLNVGGRMWAPIGNLGRQSICVIDKDENGRLKNQKLMDVSYGLLCSVESQLQGLY